MKNSSIQVLLVFVLVGLLGECSKPSQSPAFVNFKTIVAFKNLKFTKPVDLQVAGDNLNRIFVVEQPGIISVFPNDSSATAKTSFLDIQDKVQDAGGEQGLLGLAFHPDYKTNGYFYVNYTATNPERTVVSRFKVSSNPNRADAGSEQVLLTFLQPYSNHNGGQLAFGKDGYLYIATGDGGSGGDPKGNGQSKSTLLGKILRVDVNTEANGEHYGIPSDNPFAGNTEGFRQEIYAFGMRNPWRISFDPIDGKLWAGDVGQDKEEEVDIIVNGGNYGWNQMEGGHCYPPGSTNCNPTAFERPVLSYGRNEGGCIVGGYVYRGSEFAALVGKYVYADYSSRRLWALDYSDRQNPVNTGLIDVDFPIMSFGVDKDNVLYLCGQDGYIHRLKGEL